MREKIATPKAPAAIGPYAQAVRLNDFLFASGQIPVDPETGEIAGDTIESQTRQVMKNIQASLEAADMTVSDVVKTTCFLADMSDFAAFNQIYGETFTHCPARSCVAVREIPKGVLCEVEILAHK